MQISILCVFQPKQGSNSYRGWRNLKGEEEGWRVPQPAAAAAVPVSSLMLSGSFCGSCVRGSLLQRSLRGTDPEIAPARLLYLASTPRERETKKEAVIIRVKKKTQDSAAASKLQSPGVVGHARARRAAGGRTVDATRRRAHETITRELQLSIPERQRLNHKRMTAAVKLQRSREF